MHIESVDLHDKVGRGYWAGSDEDWGIGGKGRYWGGRREGKVLERKVRKVRNGRYCGGRRGRGGTEEEGRVGKGLWRKMWGYSGGRYGKRDTGEEEEERKGR